MSARKGRRKQTPSTAGDLVRVALAGLAVLALLGMLA